MKNGRQSSRLDYYEPFIVSEEGTVAMNDIYLSAFCVANNATFVRIERSDGDSNFQFVFMENHIEELRVRYFSNEVIPVREFVSALFLLKSHMRLATNRSD
jgi:hypothetical protein